MRLIYITIATISHENRREIRKKPTNDLSVVATRKKDLFIRSTESETGTDSEETF